MLELLASHGVGAVFCGHYHRNAGGVYRSPHTGRELEVVVRPTVSPGPGLGPCLGAHKARHTRTQPRAHSLRPGIRVLLLHPATRAPQRTIYSELSSPDALRPPPRAKLQVTGAVGGVILDKPGSRVGGAADPLELSGMNGMHIK